MHEKVILQVMTHKSNKIRATEEFCFKYFDGSFVLTNVPNVQMNR